jgi:hypothetical protein
MALVISLGLSLLPLIASPSRILGVVLPPEQPLYTESLPTLVLSTAGGLSLGALGVGLALAFARWPARPFLPYDERARGGVFQIVLVALLLPAASAVFLVAPLFGTTRSGAIVETLAAPDLALFRVFACAIPLRGTIFLTMLGNRAGWRALRRFTSPALVPAVRGALRPRSAMPS